MTEQAKAAYRAVVLPSRDSHPQDTPTRRLLGQLGHNVARAQSPDHALELLSADHTDLLVVDVTNSTENRDLMTRIPELPDGSRPTQVAIFSDVLDTQLNSFKKKMGKGNVHVFLKPLHMHGLLGVLRQMDKDAVALQPQA